MIKSPVTKNSAVVAQAASTVNGRDKRLVPPLTVGAAWALQ